MTAFGEYCPHLAAPMADGWVDRGRVVCPWHGSRFELESGEVQRGPPTSSLPCYEARLRDGMSKSATRRNSTFQERSDAVNAYEVLIDHHNTLRGVCKKMTSHRPGSPERQDCIDELLLELDIHLRIEDDLFCPAYWAARVNNLVAIAHGEHRQIFDQLATALRTPPKKERDMIPAPVPISDETLNEVGLRSCVPGAAV